MINDVIRDHVWTALDNALENRYFNLLRKSPLVIAEDLATFEATLEGLDRDILVPYIEAWQERHLLF